MQPQAMARGPKRHLKRLNAPRHWMLDKLGGVWAPRPSTGPHKLRECLPIVFAGAADAEAAPTAAAEIWVGEDKLVLRLKRRKNRPQGSRLVRGCFCTRDKRICPVHILGPFFK